LKDIQTATALKIAKVLGVSLDLLAGRYEEEEAHVKASVGGSPTTVVLMGIESTAAVLCCWSSLNSVRDYT
jgi:hypothetical protein